MINIFIILALLIFIAALLLIIKHLNKTEADEKPLPYRAKLYIFSRSELQFLQALRENIDTKRYLIFPKIRLADFIEVTATGKEYQTWWNKIRAKHIDYLIWDTKENKIALAIELDGNSHNSQKMQERDTFVNELYTRIGVRLERVRVGDNFVEKIKILLPTTTTPVETV